MHLDLSRNEGLGVSASSQSEAMNKAFADGGPLNIPPDSPITLTEAFLQTAQRNPSRGVTIIDGEGKASFQAYPELLRQAKCMLAGLHAQGLRAGDRVILQIADLRDHFPAFWAAVLGGITPVTVAVAPSYKEKNGVVSKLLNTWKLLGEPLILTNQTLTESIQSLHQFTEGKPLRAIASEVLKSNSPTDEIHQSRPEDLVFFQLTSGSTGIPKCIQETHRGIISHIHGSQQFNGYCPEDVSLNWLPMDHVVPILTYHLRDIYLGCQQIHIKTDYILAEPLRWMDLIHKYRATLTWAPNFGFKLIANLLNDQNSREWDLSCVRYFMNAGEQVTLPVVADFLKVVSKYGVQPKAMQPSFGMAEACTCMTYQNEFDLERGIHFFSKKTGKIDPEAKISSLEEGNHTTFIDLGPPVPGVQIRITDKDNNLVPEGVIGRFQIKGAVITPGYLNNESANREAFVGDGWFNSGDLGFIWNGRLTLTGREKEMIIIRGANYYAYEIEDVVNQIEGVEPTFVAACAVEDAASGTEGLAIFFVPKEISRPECLSLIRKIKGKVSASMGILPSYVIPIDRKSFPKTTSGKIQRTQLKKSFEAGQFQEKVNELTHAESSSQSSSHSFQSESESKIASIWKTVLNGRAPAPSDLFFEHGDSLRAAQLIARLRDSFGVDIPIQLLFETSATVSGIAAYISANAQRSRSPLSVPILSSQEAEPYRASYSQRRMWFLDSLQQGTAVYNVPIAISISGPLDVQLLESSINELLQRHEILRTRYALNGAEIYQEVLAHKSSELPVVDLEKIAVPARKEHARKLAMAEAQIPFDLSKGPVIRHLLLRLNPLEHLLVVTCHQIATDGWSLGIYVKDLAAVYESLRNKAQPPKALQIQYRDYARWQLEQFRGPTLDAQINYWKEKLAGPLPQLKLPVKNASSSRTGAGGTESTVLPSPVLSGLKELGLKENCSLFVTLLSGFKLLLRSFSESNDILVGTASGGRHRLEVEPLIGFFVNTLALRTQYAGDPTFREFLKLVRKVVLESQAHQDVPFDHLIAQLRKNRSDAPEIQVWFALNERLPEVKAGSTEFKASKVIIPATQFDLTLFAVDEGDRLAADWEYSTDLLDRSTILTLMQRFETLIQCILRNPDKRLSELLCEAKLTSPQPIDIAQVPGKDRLRQSLLSAKRQSVRS